jgi:hypothetical protein
MDHITPNLNTLAILTSCRPEQTEQSPALLPFCLNLKAARLHGYMIRAKCLHQGVAFPFARQTTRPHHLGPPPTTKRDRTASLLEKSGSKFS